MSPNRAGERVPQHALPDEPCAPSTVEVSTEKLASCFEEVAQLVGLPCDWVELGAVELVVGYLPVPDGMCTVYIGAIEASVWLPREQGAPQRHTGPLAELVPIVYRAATVRDWPRERAA